MWITGSGAGGGVYGHGEPENRSEGSARKAMHMLNMHILPIIMDSAKRNGFIFRFSFPLCCTDYSTGFAVCQVVFYAWRKAADPSRTARAR